MQKIDPTRAVSIPVGLHPLFRTHIAAQNGVHKNLLFSTWGGIGDVICSEPTVRFACEKFKDCKITVATHHPQVFKHLKHFGADVYDLNFETPIMDDYLVLHTIPTQGETSLIPLFLSHMVTNCVDFPALSALRMQLPIANRYVQMVPDRPQDKQLLSLGVSRAHVIVHAGRHWKSKTFPKSWWDEVLESIKNKSFIPVLIGKDGGESQGYVDVSSRGCVDLRDQTSLNDSIWLLQNSAVLVCNDSSPLHMAASGYAWILFVASVKHPDYITHYRRFGGSEFGWRMNNLSRGGLWEKVSVCPNRTDDLSMDECSSKDVEALLPDPSIFGPLCEEKMNDYFRDL